MWQFGFKQIVTTILADITARRRNVDLAAVSDAQFFYPCLKSCAPHRTTEIVALFKKKITDECMIASPGPPIAPSIVF